MRALLMALVMVGAMIGAGCGTQTLPAGAVCTADSACDTGLSCLDLAQSSGSTCTVVGKVCSIVCKYDPDCASLGTSFKCFNGCSGATNFCGEVAR